MQTANEYLYESYDENWQRLYFDLDSKGFVVAHKGHGRDELPLNRSVAIRLAKHFGEAIELLPNLNTHKLRSADATRNGEVWEWKKIIGTSTSVQGRLRTGGKQSPKILLTLPQGFDESDVLRGLMSAVNIDKTNRIQVVDFLLPNNRLVRLEREKIRRRDFKDFFDALK